MNVMERVEWGYTGKIKFGLHTPPGERKLVAFVPPVLGNTARAVSWRFFCPWPSQLEDIPAKSSSEQPGIKYGPSYYPALQ